MTFKIIGISIICVIMTVLFIYLIGMLILYHILKGKITREIEDKDTIIKDNATSDKEYETLNNKVEEDKNLIIFDDEF